MSLTRYSAETRDAVLRRPASARTADDQAGISRGQRSARSRRRCGRPGRMAVTQPA